MGRAPPGLDPRLPHGRAGDPVVRPRAAARVPRRPRGHGRRRPRRPRRRRHHRRGRRRGRSSRRRSSRWRRAASTRSSTGRSSTTFRDWFTEHPLYDPAGQPIVVPEWRFTGRGRVQGQLNRTKAVIGKGEKALHALPLRGRQAELSARLETKRQEVERALEYVELYGLYTECEAIYEVDQLLAVLGPARSTADQEAFDFDPRSVDWHHYVTQIHLPSIVQAQPGQDHAGQVVERPVGPAAGPGAGPRAAPRGLRSREHADRLERGRELLVDRHPAARPRRARAGTCCGRSPRRPACCGSTGPTAPTSCATSTAATSTRRSSRSRPTPVTCSRR